MKNFGIQSVHQYLPIVRMLAPNSLLSSAVPLDKGDFSSSKNNDNSKKNQNHTSVFPLRPEAFAEDGHNGFYASLGDGRIVHFIHKTGNLQ